MRKRLIYGWTITLLAGLACGCGNQDAERLSRIGRKSVDRMAEMVGGKKGNVACGWEAFRASFGESALDSRVCCRLAWEKTLADVHIQVKIVKPGVVLLRGHVREFQQRMHAQDVALGTLGVKNVINELIVATP